MLQLAMAHAARSEDRFVNDLKTILRIPSVSTSRIGIEQCVRYLVEHLSSIGFNVEVDRTSNNPVLLGFIPGRSDKTLLFYGHYDVQPPDPIELWNTGPFEACEMDGRIYARGAVDDKGNFMCILKAIQSYVEACGEPPCNVKIILEGEEEIGSPGLQQFIMANLSALRCNDMVWFDGGVHSDGRPEICLGMKGMVYVELRVTTNPRDLHSGKAPLVDNAAWRMVQALNTLVTLDGRVAIPGFYDNVVPPGPRDLEFIGSAGLEKEHLLRDWGIHCLNARSSRLSGADLLRRLFFEPTCTICGMSSGYTGDASKTIVPAEAIARVDMRLVPDQDPAAIVASLRRHLAAQGFGDIEITVRTAMKASKSRADAPIVGLVMDVMKSEYGRPVVKPIVEGSGPGYVFERLGVPYVFARLGPPEDRSHAPNEYTTREAYRKGISAVIRLLDAYSR